MKVFILCLRTLTLLVGQGDVRVCNYGMILVVPILILVLLLNYVVQRFFWISSAMHNSTFVLCVLVRWQRRRIHPSLWVQYVVQMVCTKWWNTANWSLRQQSSATPGENSCTTLETSAITSSPETSFGRWPCE